MTAAVAEPGIVRRVFREVMRSLVRKEQNVQGVMVALFLPPEVAAELAQPGGVPPDQLHLTLSVVAEDASKLEPAQIDALAAQVQRAATDTPVLTGRVSGVGRFNGDQAGGEDVVYATIDAPGLVQLFDRVRWIRPETLEGYALPEYHGPSDHDWTPHVTLAYGNEAETPEVATMPVRFDRLTLAIGTERREYLFAGAATARVPVSYRDDGAARELIAKALDAAGEAIAGDMGDAGWLGALEVEGVGVRGDLALVRAGGLGGQVFTVAPDGSYAPDYDRPRPKGAPVTKSVPLERIRVVRSEPAQRYTLGVAYPARQIGKAVGSGDVDAHADYMTADQLEGAAWRFMAGGAKPSGLMHKDGTGGAGQVVESYIWRGPTWKVEGQEVEPGDWLLGVVWDEVTWPKIESGELTGYSLQGFASREVV